MTIKALDHAGTSLGDTRKTTSPADTGYLRSTDDISSYHAIPSPGDIASRGATSARELIDSLILSAIDDLKGAGTVDRLRGYRFNESFNHHTRIHMQTELLNYLLVVRNRAAHPMPTSSVSRDDPYLITETATDIEPFYAHLEDQILSYVQKLANDSVDEVFVDGMESNFSKRLIATIGTYGETAVRATNRMINLDTTSAEVVGETLRQIGYLQDMSTHETRLSMLVKKLESNDPRIRDAATLGLSAMDDPKCIDALLEALSREESPQLRSNYQIVLDQLHNTKWPNT